MNIDELRNAATKLVSLLSDPQPGLSTWCMFLGGTLTEIAAFAPATPPSPESLIQQHQQSAESLRQLIADLSSGPNAMFRMIEEHASLHSAAVTLASMAQRHGRDWRVSEHAMRILQEQIDAMAEAARERAEMRRAA